VHWGGLFVGEIFIIKWFTGTDRGRLRIRAGREGGVGCCSSGRKGRVLGGLVGGERRFWCVGWLIFASALLIIPFIALFRLKILISIFMILFFLFKGGFTAISALYLSLALLKSQSQRLLQCLLTEAQLTQVFERVRPSALRRPYYTVSHNAVLRNEISVSLDLRQPGPGLLRPLL
jgi:hypothetical protein